MSKLFMALAILVLGFMLWNLHKELEKSQVSIAELSTNLKEAKVQQPLQPIQPIQPKPSIIIKRVIKRVLIPAPPLRCPFPLD